MNQFEEAEYIPIPLGGNIAIGVSGPGAKKGFSCLITNTLPDLGVLECSQWFSFYLYETLDEMKEVAA